MRQASHCSRWLKMTQQRCPAYVCAFSTPVTSLPAQTAIPSPCGFASYTSGVPATPSTVKSGAIYLSTAARRFSAAAAAPAAKAETEPADVNSETETIPRSEFERDGVQYSFESGGLAPMADGSCLAKAGNTWVHAVVSRSEANRFHDKIKPTIHVDYREPMAAVGKMPGGRSKLEGSPNEREHETALLIEQSVAPLFAPGFSDNVQITATLLCTDGEANASCVAINAVSAALLGSGIPWRGPCAAVQVASAQLGDTPKPAVIQPTTAQLGSSSMAGLYVGTGKCVLLADLQGEESAEMQPKDMKALLQAAHSGTSDFLNAQRSLVKSQGASAHGSRALSASTTVAPTAWDPAALGAVTGIAQPLIADILGQTDLTHDQRISALQEAKESMTAKLVKKGIFRNQVNRVKGSGCANQTDIEWAWGTLLRKAIGEQLANDNERMDGRGLINPREATYQMGVLPVVHGSALVSHGASQALATAVVGDGLADQAKSEGITGEHRKQLMVQINDRVAATSQASTSGRDRVSDGIRNRINASHSRALERCLQPAFPSDTFPFAVRLSIDLLAAGGSDSMMALSAASLALIDAGVPLQAQLAGTQVATFVGHVTAPGSDSQDDEAVRLSVTDTAVDPQQLECEASDLTLQMVGSQRSITALRAHVTSSSGVPLNALQKSISPAWRSLRRQHSKLDTAAQSHPSSENSRLASLSIPQEMVGRLIGPKGSNIKRLRETTGSLISIDESQDNGQAELHLFTPGSDHVAEVVQTIEGFTGADLQEGSVHTVTVKRLMDFGAIVEFPTGSSTLLHISNLSHTRVRSIDDVLSIGQQIQVKIMGHDAKGQLQVSHKALTASPVSPDVDVGRPQSDRPSFTRRPGEGQQRPQRLRPRIPQGA